MADTLHLSVLDQSPVRAGGTAREALLATVELARAADRLGYSRYWLAEHHNSNTLASASPEVLIPVVAGATERIRVGSGGVMLTHYSALKVAEQFRMLETLFPGRIDIGLGRAPGSDGHTANALRHGPGALPLEAYPSQVADLIAYMGDTIPEGHRFRGIRAIPAGDSMPAPWLLGSAYDSAQFAAQLGIGFAFAQFISPDGGQKVVQAYRDQFRPSALLAEPRVIIGTPALCADTEAEAHRIGMSRHLMRLRRAEGRPSNGIPTIEEALGTSFIDPELDYIRYQQSLTVEGDPEQVREGLLALAAEYEVDELMIVTITHDYAHRIRSYELLAGAFNLPGVAEALPVLPVPSAG